MRVRSIIAALLIGSLLAGCGNAGGTEPAGSEAAAASPEAAEESAVAGETQDAGTVPLVGIVAYAVGIEDGGFNQSAWEGLQRLAGTSDCETSFLESNAEGDFQENIHKLVDAGGDLCWAIGYSCADILREEAEEHPDRSFAIVDYAYEDTPSNMTGVMFRAEESAFLAGYVAGCVTESGKLGFIGGESNEVIDQFRYGYQAGAWYAGKELGREITVETAYTGSFADVAGGRDLAADMYDRGCDIVFHAAGESGMGVIDAAREAGKYVIGADKDQSYLAPEQVLTSVLKDVNSAVYQVSRDYLEGNPIGGRTIELGLAEDAVGQSEEHSLYSDEIYTRMLVLRDRIVSGELDPPAGKPAYEQFIGG